MKNGISLTELAREIERRANAKKDVVVSTKNLEMIAPTQDKEGMLLNVGDELVFGVNSIAHQQIGEHADIPRKYYDKMLARDPHLLATNVNAWFQHDAEDRMVRTLDGDARAFLSSKYRTLENEDLAQAALPALMERDLHVMSCAITEQRLYIKAVDMKVKRELDAIGGNFGDGQHKIVRCLSPAITISNSEVGMGALSILGGVYDAFCSNLATFGERSVRRYHVGKRHELGEDVYALLSDETRRVTDKALWAQIGDVVRAAFDRAKFDSLTDKILATREAKIEGDVPKVVEVVRRKFTLTEGEGASILRHLIEGAELSQYGLHNAITRASQDVEDYDRATAFERLGGQIIDLPAREWKELAKAA